MTPTVRGLMLVLWLAGAGTLAGCEPTVIGTDDRRFEPDDRTGRYVEGVRVFRAPQR